MGETMNLIDEGNGRYYLSVGDIFEGKKILSIKEGCVHYNPLDETRCKDCSRIVYVTGRIGTHDGWCGSYVEKVMSREL